MHLHLAFLCLNSYVICVVTKCKWVLTCFFQTQETKYNQLVKLHILTPHLQLSDYLNINLYQNYTIVFAKKWSVLHHLAAAADLT